jgi:hypothetical protein
MKLINGDEIIAKFVEQTQESYKISKPRLVAVTGSLEGNIQLMLLPWLFSADTDKDEIILNKNFVIMITKSNENVRINYLQQISNLRVISNMNFLKDS